MTPRGILLTAAAAALLSVGTTQAQSDDPAALRKEIDSLKAGQQAIQKELGEIKKLLQAQRPQPRQNRREPFKPTDISIKGAPFLGRPNAKVTMVEFTDYQCPFCRRHFTQVLPEIQKQYVATGKVKYVMRQFPLVSIHPRATKASEAALCAGDQGKYWQVHQRIFGAQRKLSDDDLRAHAEAEGLNLSQFDGCLTNGKYNEQVKADTSEGSKAGVQGTPSFFLGLTDPADPNKIRAVEFIRGAQGLPAFQAKIDALLNGKKGD